MSSAQSGFRLVNQEEEKNRILRLLPASSYARLHPYLQDVELSKKEVLWRADDLIPAVYFPRTAAMSFIVTLRERAPVEAATVGNEGIVGVSVALGVDRGSMLVLAQIPGVAARISTHLFRTLADDDASLRLMASRSTHAVLDQAAQSVACNRRHSSRQRCARWILMTHDRAHSDDFPLTHQMLSLMLGVRRAGVTNVALQLQREGMIAYRHGSVTVKSRSGLEAAACECYQSVEQRYHRLFGNGVAH